MGWFSKYMASFFTDRSTLGLFGIAELIITPSISANPLVAAMFKNLKSSILVIRIC